MTVDAVRLVVQLALGGVFVLSGAGKLRHPLAFLRGVAEYDILPRPLAYAFGAVLVPLELLLALALLSGTALPVALPAGACLIVIFGVAVTVNLRRRRDMLCHCYGGLGGERLSVRSLAQLGLLFAGVLLVWSGGGGSVGRLSGSDEVLAAAAWAACCLMAGLWLLHADQVVRLFRRTCRTCARGVLTS